MSQMQDVTNGFGGPPISAVTGEGVEGEGLSDPPTLRSDTLLLREARHRIGNSLQIVATILLQSAWRLEAEEARAHLQAAYGRVMAIAALERQLSDTPADAVALHLYLVELCDHLTAGAIEDPARISLRVRADQDAVTAGQAADIGMIVAELVINALKHAFPDQRRGQVTITYETEPLGWRLTVADDGVGMPAEVVGRGLGTEIVRALVRQLGATLEVCDALPGRATVIRGGRRNG